MNIKDLHQRFLSSSGISTDTRKIENNSIFFALKGSKFDANLFAAEALEKGAKLAVVDEQNLTDDDRLIKVPDVLEKLQELALYHRNHLGIPIIALTGSNGKTTTKELINAALSRKYKTFATVGNLNNHIGVPLTLLSMTKSTEIGVVEMGANHLKEIEFLCKIAQPDYGFITNFGKAHLEGFGGVQGVIQGKKELYAHLRSRNKVLFINLDDPLQKEEVSYERHFSFGKDPSADLSIFPFLKNNQSAIKTDHIEIASKLAGIHNARNLAAAFSIASFFKVDKADIKAALEDYVSENNRSQMVLIGSTQIILDAYNANPTSMAAALESFKAMAGSKKIVILGDMLELGNLAAQEHEVIVKKVEEMAPDKIYLIGPHFFSTPVGDPTTKYNTYEDFRNFFDPADTAHALVLIKGSRAMALERVLDLI